MCSNSSILLALGNRLLPKYLESESSSLMLRLSFIEAFRLPRIFLEKKQPDLVGLKLCPVQEQNFSKQLMILFVCCTSALQKIRISSAKNKWVMAWPVLPIFIPWISPSISILLIMRDRSSSRRTNKKGDKGSPCLIPCYLGISPKHEPFSIIFIFPVVRHLRISRLNLLSKPYLSRIWSRTYQLTQSYALWRSIFMPTKPFVPFVIFIKWIISLTRIEFSPIQRPGTNAAWLGDIKDFSRRRRHWTRIFEKILYMVLHKAIGRIWLKVEKFLVFGIRTTKESLNLEGTTLYENILDS